MNAPITYSPQYKAIQEQFHTERPDYGVSGHKYADAVTALARNLKTDSILDYGCGKCTLSRSLPFPIQNYDPFIRAYAAYPTPADIVVCTDVMEHVEEDFVRDVLIDIRNLTRKVVFFQIATRPAQKILPDGRNAHITLHSAAWWTQQLCQYFEPMQFDNQGGGFVFLGSPRNDE